MVKLARGAWGDLAGKVVADLIVARLKLRPALVTGPEVAWVPIAGPFRVGGKRLGYFPPGNPEPVGDKGGATGYLWDIRRPVGSQRSADRQAPRTSENPNPR